MKFSQNIQRCGLSPMRKFNPYAVKAKAAGKKIFHLNIGQPDIETPPAFFDAITGFRESVLAYAPSPGVPAYLDAVRDYYVRMGIEIETSDILATTGGSEALQIALSCILDPGDEILVPEPFYPNYNTFVSLTGGKIAPIPTTPEEKQAMAAIGQSELMKIYDKFFSVYGHTVAQILMTKDVLTNPTRRAAAENTFNRLLQMHCIPIVNENDCISTDELTKFG